MSDDLPFHARFGGIDWRADLPLAQFDSASTSTGDAITVIRQDRPSDIGTTRTVRRATIGTHGLWFDWDDEARFELTGGSRIGWIPGPHWRGELPPSFYSSMAAIALAWRGLVPLHASAIVMHDRAWLIAGRAGAGKSSLTAELLTVGAQFLADDLTIVTPGRTPTAARGRPAMRLHPATAAEVAHHEVARGQRDGRGKVLIEPQQRAGDRAWQIGGILALNDQAAISLSPAEAAETVASALFRPRIISALPGRAALRAHLLDLAAAVPVTNVPLVRGFDAVSRAARLDAACAAMDRLRALSPRS